MDSRYNTRTSYIGNKTPPDQFSALKDIAKLRDARKHPATKHLVSSDAAEFTETLIMLALNWYTMRANSLALSGQNLFPINSQAMLGESAPVDELQDYALRRWAFEETTMHAIDELLQKHHSCVQVVVLNGGLNSFALRLQKHFSSDLHQLKIFDVHFPGESCDILSFALGRLSMMRAHPHYDYVKRAVNLVTLKCDPAYPKWEEQLFSRKNKFDKTQPTIIVGENLSVLADEDLHALFAMMRNVMTDESKLILSLPNNPESVPRMTRRFDFLAKGKMLFSSFPSLYLLEPAPTSNVCRLDEMDLRTIPALQTCPLPRQGLSVNSSP